MNGWYAVYLREMIILKRRLKRQISGMAVAPLLYLVAFDCAMGGQLEVHGRPYTTFLLPGLAAMASMTQAFGIATDINVARFYWHIFEVFQAAPIRNAAYVTGEVLAGMTRAMLGVGVILILGLPFGVVLNYGPLFWLALLLNSFLFSALAVALAMAVKSHADQGLLINFVITPMAFLGGTFFPVDQLPVWAQIPIRFLPLTHASTAARTVAFGQIPDPGPYLLLAAMGTIFYLIAWYTVNLARD